MQMNRRQLLKSSAITAAVLPVATGLTLATTGCNTNWIDIAIKDIPTAEGIAQSILGIVTLASGNLELEPAVATLIKVAGTAAIAGLTTLETLINQYKVAPNSTVLDKIDVALTDLQSNLSSILQIGGIKNANLQVAISTAVGLAIAVISAIQTLVPAAPVSSAIRRAAPHKLVKATVVPDSAQIASMFNAVMVLHGFEQFQVK